MTDLSAQKRLAADVLDVGKNRIWFDPSAQDEIGDAITRADIRDLIDRGIVQAMEPSGNSRGRARERDDKRAYGHRKGPGSRKGKSGGRQDAKEQWAGQIRAQRRVLRELRDDGELTPRQYRDLYDKASGGEFRSVRYLRNFIATEYGEA